MTGVQRRGGICIFKKLPSDEERSPSLTLWFLLKLFPFYSRGFNDSHSTFIHRTPKSPEPRLLSQITDLQDQMPANYLQRDTRQTQIIRTVITIFPST